MLIFIAFRVNDKEHEVRKFPSEFEEGDSCYK